MCYECGFAHLKRTNDFNSPDGLCRRGFLLVVMMERQGTELKNDVKYQEKPQDLDVDNYQPESIARCVLRSRNNGKDGISIRNGLPRLGWLEAAHQML